MRRLSRVVFLCVAMANGVVLGSGMLIPKDQSMPPLAIEHQRVDIEIKDGVATARIEQVFKNSENRDVEAVYVFPLPQNASIADFAMYIDGKRVSGELVEKDKARKIYEDIVRRMKDPGLLEHIGGNLFKVRVYPVRANADQKIELNYSQTLEFDGGLYKYVYPLKTGERASRTLEDFTVSLRLTSGVPIKNIYSPSHKVGISRKGDNEAVIGFEEEQALLDRDFVLYYSVSKKEFGLNLLTHAVEGEDGYFMMMLAPAAMASEKEVMRKDIIFVLDSSGSMAGKKIEQAREALEYCVRTLNDGDRFNVVRFSTDVEPLAETLVEANEVNRQKALEFVGDIVARGGTAIDGALAAILEMKHEKGRPAIVAFLTDGKPTIGESDTDIILSNLEKGNKAGVRIFVFGVGENVNTHLLDRISGQNGGVSRYVAPDEDIEVKLSLFADKVSSPVLAKLAIDIEKLKTRKLHPQELPDLFKGDQLTVFGRYEGQGHVAIRLTGEVGGEKRDFVYEETFAKANTGNVFIPRLWATRRVGYLLDEIRLRGEDKELKDEILRLSKEHGIMTPYTSYLVLQDDKAYRDHGIVRAEREAAPIPKRPSLTVFAAKARSLPEPQALRGNAGAEPGPLSGPVPGTAMVPMFDQAGTRTMIGAGSGGADELRTRVVTEGEESVRRYMRNRSGRHAVDLSEAIREYKRAERAGEGLAAVQHVGKKIFYFIDGRWIDNEYRQDMKIRKIAFAGDEYFELIDEHPGLKDYLALGEKVIIVLDDGTAVEVE